MKSYNHIIFGTFRNNFKKDFVYFAKLCLKNQKALKPTTLTQQNLYTRISSA